MKTFGKGAVEMEDGFVGIKLRREGKVTLIEVKSDSRPRYAIREAIGHCWKTHTPLNERAKSFAT